MSGPIDWDKQAHHFRPGRRAAEIAYDIGCSERVVYARAKMIGFDFVNGGLTAEKKPENQTINPAQILRGKIPDHMKPRPLEDMSSAPSNFVECDS